MQSNTKEQYCKNEDCRTIGFKGNETTGGRGYLTASQQQPTVTNFLTPNKERKKPILVKSFPMPDDVMKDNFSIEMQEKQQKSLSFLSVGTGDINSSGIASQTNRLTIFSDVNFESF